MLNSDSKSSTLKKQKRSPIKSIGTKLFAAVIGGAIVGLGGTAYLFYQNLEKQTTEKIQQTVDLETQKIVTELQSVSQASKNLAATIEFFQRKGFQDTQFYESSVLEFYKTRAKFAMAAYFGQTPYGIIKSKEWYFPYFYVDQKSEEQIGSRLSTPNNDTIYSELFKDDNYPSRDYYKIPVAKKAPVWLEPFPWYGITMTTFTWPIFDKNGKMIGFSGSDVNITSISKNIASTVLNNRGYFALISEEGKLLSYTPNPKKALDIASYDTVPELKAIWSQIGKKEAGIIKSNGQYWSFRRIKENNWLMLAAVPESVVQMPILSITLAGTLGAGFILAGTIFWFVRRLNKKLDPILAQCENLGEFDLELQEAIRQNDEIDGLSLSLSELLRQLNDERERVRQEAESRLAEVQERLNLSQQVEKEGEILQTEIGKILDVVATLESGDFRTKAEVGEGVTGLVANSLNLFVEEITNTLSTVSTAAEQVSTSAELLGELAEDVATNAAKQAQGAEIAMNLTESVNNSARDSTEQLEEMGLKLDRVNKAVQKGEAEIKVIGLAISGLQRGKDQMRQQMLALGEFVSIAEQFVEEQKQIASLSQTLAMSANLLAARASEQKDPRQFLSVSREFGTISEQMKTLAQQTNNGLTMLQKRTDTVRLVVSTVSREVESMASLVENFTYGVDLSQQIFDRVRQAAGELIQTEESIVSSNQSIADAARSSAETMKEIATLAARTAHLTQTTNEQSEAMKKLSSNLIQALSLFELPERAVSG
jgi:twitching motility protein PilJ